jgi:hypothetical protein
MSAQARRIIDPARRSTKSLDGDVISLARGAFAAFEKLGLEASA